MAEAIRETADLTIETRMADLTLEVRDDGTSVLAGYAVVYNSTADLGWFTEEIAPGAFDAHLQSGADVRALFNHDAGRVLGRRSKGTLTIKPDEKGLYVEINPPKSAADVVEGIQRGDYSAMSFGFRKNKDQWSTRDGGKKHRRILDASISEVSIVAFPAYEATSIGIRDASAKESWEQHQREQQELDAKLANIARRARSVSLDDI